MANDIGSTDGTNSYAQFNDPFGVAVDSVGNIYVADSGNSTIRKITPVGTNWVVTTLAGKANNMGSTDGTNDAARFDFPSSVAVDNMGNLYVADQANDTIRMVTPTGTVKTLGGLADDFGSADGSGSNARFGFPSGVAVDSSGIIYVADVENNTIRKGIASSSVPSPMLIFPPPSASQFGFGISGLPGLAVNVESSPDLLHWQVIGSYVLVAGTNNFVNPTPFQGAQFYRGHVR
jgi:hypothetical protein